MQRAFLLIPLLALAGCVASPEQRVDAALREAGVSPRIAGCMAEHMADRLSIAQLKQLKAIGKDRAPGEKLKAKQVLKRVAAIGDPEIVSVTSKAALHCYISA